MQAQEATPRSFECPRFGGHWLSFPQLFDECHADIGVAQRPEGCLCSHTGHLYRGLDTKTDPSS